MAAADISSKYAAYEFPANILQQLAKKESLAEALDAFIAMGLEHASSISPGIANQLFIAASTLKPRCKNLRPVLAKYIATSQLKESNQV